MLSVCNLSFHYPSGDDVLSNVNLTVSKGECVFLEGRNGTGKSTLLKLVSGLLTPTNGNIHFEDFTPKENGFKQRLLYIPPEPLVLGSLTGYEHSKLCKEWWNCKDIEGYDKQFSYFSEMLALEPYLSLPLNQCSNGTQYKIYLAVMLARNPSLILLDEPFTSMDKISQDHITNYLLEYKSNAAIVLVTHQEEFSNKLADAHLLLKDNVINEVENK